MLSSDFPRTPRPKPPAKARRQSAQFTNPRTDDWRSPPPYTPSGQHLPSLLGSPISATTQFIQLQEARCESGIQQRSRDELEDLLDRASGIIREREQELDITSETCRSLAESNNALKARNDALLTRIPSSGASSPSPLGSPSSSISYLSLVSHTRTPSNNPPWSPRCTPPPSNRRLKHRRRMSSNPAELAALADQNAELLARLADLEADSARADQAGKKRLKALEGEISNLREELELVRSETEKPPPLSRMQTNDEGDGNAELLSELKSDAQVLKMLKKLTREAKVRELKEKTRPWDKSDSKSASPHSLEAPRDFAPGSLAPGLPFSSKWVARKSSAPFLKVETTDLRGSEFGLSQSPSTPLSVTPTAASLAATTTSNPTIPSPLRGESPSKSEREHALVSQLLLKIRELEETNQQLAADHIAARERLKNAQTETEGVRQLCELISQGVDESMEFDLELELVNDSGEESPRFELEVGHADAAEEAGNDRLADLTDFQNCRPKRLRVRSMSKHTSLDVGSRKHSLRVRRTASIDSFVTAKSRIFGDEDDEGNGDDTDHGESTSRHTRRERKSVLGLFDSLAKDEESFSLPGAMPKSPDPRKASLSSIDLSSPDRRLEEHRSSREELHVTSLGSELGLALEGLGPAPDMHGRTNSIIELFQDFEISPTGNPTHERVSSASTLPRSAHLKATSKASTAIQRLIDEGDGVESSDPSPRHRLRRTHTNIPSRPTHSPSSTLTVSPPSSPPLSRRLFTSPSLNTLSSHRNPRSLQPFHPLRHQRSQLLRHSASKSELAMSQKAPTNKALNMLVEVWLWLQFALVLGVVLFSMARMGPKSFFKPASSANKR